MRRALIWCVCGSRNYPDKPRAQAAVWAILKRDPAAVIMTGGCRNSPDEWAGRAARITGAQTLTLEASWQRDGKSAGPRRNSRMAIIADRVLAFWDGKSTGTLDMIRKAHARGTRVDVCLPGEQSQRWTGNDAN